MSTTKFRDNEREAAQAKAKALKKKKRKKKTVTALIIILMVSVIISCILSLTVFFKIENISVTGNDTYTAEEILTAAEINKGDNLILLNGKKISERLQILLPFVEKIEVKKTFPETLKIIVLETKEEVCFVNDNNCYSANKNGKVIKKYNAPIDNLIKITVSKEVNLNLGEKIKFSNEREETLFNNYLVALEELNYKIDFINISDAFTSYMKIDDRIIVKFGSSSYFKEKVAYLKASLAGISHSAEGVFDLSAWTPDNNQPVLTYGDISSYEK